MNYVCLYCGLEVQPPLNWHEDKATCIEAIKEHNSSLTEKEINEMLDKRQTQDSDNQ